MRFTTIRLVGYIIGHNWYGDLGKKPFLIQINNRIIREHGFKGAIERFLKEEGGDFQDPDLSPCTYFDVERTTQKTQSMRIIQSKNVYVNRLM